MKKNSIRFAGLALVAAGTLAFTAPNMATAAGTNLLVNPGFESPAGAVASSYAGMVPDADFPGWQTTDSQGKFEVWDHADQTTADLQYIELNAYSAGAVYQDIETTSCDILTFSVQHRARLVGTDVMHVLAGEAGGTGSDGLTVLEATSRDDVAIDATTEISDEIGAEGDDTAWHTWTGTYQVPAGQMTTRLAFAAVSSASGDVTAGNFLDNVSVTAETADCPTAANTGSLADTGLDTKPLAIGSVLAVALGGGLVVIARRRKYGKN